MKRHVVLLCACVLVASLAAAAGAQVSLYGQAGYTTFVLDEFNDVIQSINADGEGGPGEWDPMPEIRGGWLVSAGVAYSVAPNVSLRGGVEYVNVGKSVGTYTEDTPTGTSTGVSTLSSSALGITVGAAYHLPVGALNLDLTGDVGYYRVPLHYDLTVDGAVDDELDAVGTGIGFQAGINGTYALGVNFDLVFGIGYRFLTVSELKDENGDVVVGFSGDPLQMELSGIVGRVGVAYRF